MSKYAESMIKKYGTKEKWLEHLRAIGSQGGKNGTGHAFAHGKVDPADAGRKGGSSKKPKEEQDEE